MVIKKLDKIQQEYLDKLTDSIEEILSVSLSQLKSKIRTRNVVNSRKILCGILYQSKLIYDIPFITTSTLGEYLNRDHTLVYFYKQEHLKLVETEKDYIRAYNEVYRSYSNKVYANSVIISENLLNFSCDIIKDNTGNIRYHWIINYKINEKEEVYEKVSNKVLNITDIVEIIKDKLKANGK